MNFGKVIALLKLFETPQLTYFEVLKLPDFLHFFINAGKEVLFELNKEVVLRFKVAVSFFKELKQESEVLNLGLKLPQGLRIWLS